MKNLPKKEPLQTTDRIQYMKYVMKNLPSMGFSAEVDERINEVKADLFAALFDLTESGSAALDTEILFDAIMEDCRDMFYLVSPSLQLLERSKANSDEV